jgi:phosphoribosylpyrophosphate synthetase
MEAIAQHITELDRSIILGDVKWDLFGDDYPETFVEKQRGIRRMNVAFLASLENPSFILEQLGAAMTIAGYGLKHFRFLLPFFPPGFKDRADDEGEVITADILAQMISLLPVTSRPEVVIYDIHALQLKSYFAKHVVVRLKSALKYFFPILRQMGDVSVCFPDYGSRKRFARFFKGYQQIICEKVRGKGEERIVKIVDGDPCGRRVVIVDDAFMTCETTLKCKDALFGGGAIEVSAYGTHGRFPKDSWHKFIDAGFKTIWITDSCPVQAAQVVGKPPFHVISLAESIARVITDRDGF